VRVTPEVLDMLRRLGDKASPPARWVEGYPTFASSLWPLFEPPTAVDADEDAIMMD